ncbi:MAG: zinc-ribbon domain-containing protein [Bacteroides sp.]|nr:zinc-ribbon domain-containing protein [Eubacterium sp.]MCM1418554.1 zinc-ribbon domain-containing protein [Roseburia sp.]MCM1462609.1 zinc-ribbon domain-containing protein [Bacteroides sp.]
MPQVFCPKCGTEIPEGTIVCPSCGYDIQVYNNEAETELNSLLNAKKISDGEAAENGGAASSEGASATSGEGASPAPDAAGTPVRAVKKKSAPKSEETSPDPSEETAETAGGSPDEEGSEKEEDAGLAAPSQKKKKAKKEKKPKEKKTRKPIPPFVITLFAVVVAAALGFCASLLIFGDFFPPAEESFAVTAANAVNSKLNVNEKLCVYKAYVKTTASADECILYAIIDYRDTVSVTRYRVVFDRSDPSVINVYYPVDETSDAYLAMKNSDDPRERIQASVLKNYSDTIEAAHREIQIGSPAWVEVDISKINGKITSKQTRNTGSSVTAEQTLIPEDDEDIADLAE